MKLNCNTYRLSKIIAKYIRSIAGGKIAYSGRRSKRVSVKRGLGVGVFISFSFFLFLFLFVCFCL